MFVMKIFPILGLGMLLVGSSASMTHAAELVTNGGFETGSFSGWTQIGDTDFTGVDIVTPHTGTYAASLAPDGALGFLSQTLATLPQQTYALSFFLQNEDTNYAGASNQFEVLAGGNTLFSQTNLSTVPYIQYAFNFVATGNSTELTFGFRNNLSYFALDDVSVAAVPEPSSISGILALSALGTASLLKRQLTGGRRL